LRGTVQLPGENTRALPAADLIEWFKPARPRARFFPQGFTVTSPAMFLN
jgi:hypothetical protein